MKFKVKKTFLFLVTFFFITIFKPAPTYSTTFVNRPLNDVIKEASAIVRGEAIDSYSDWGKGQTKAIYTYTRFLVTEVLKGEVKEKEILLRQPGGSKDGIEMNVPGTANFVEKVEIVVFLGDLNADDASYDVPGFTTGKYDLVKENGTTFIVNSLGGEAIYDARKDPKTLSYNSKIPLGLLRKIIKGNATEKEIQKFSKNQYEESEKKPPPHAFEADHEKHKVAASLTEPPKLPEIQAEEKKSWYVPLSFAFLVVAGVLLVLFVLKNGRKD